MTTITRAMDTAAEVIQALQALADARLAMIERLNAELATVRAERDAWRSEDLARELGAAEAELDKERTVARG